MAPPPHPDEFQAAERRIRARVWLRRARMVQPGVPSEVPSLLDGDSLELERQDYDTCDRWYQNHGYLAG